MNVTVSELSEAKAKYEDLREKEATCRDEINDLRRELNQICRERKAAYEAWQDECRKLVG